MLARLTAVAVLALASPGDSPPMPDTVPGQYDDRASEPDDEIDHVACGVSLTATGISCTAVHFMCPLSAVAAACTCIPLFDDTKTECR
jgi:hypothetical protein